VFLKRGSMDDSYSNATCPTCNAQWFGGQLYWSTGKLGDPHDLAGLVCNTLKDYGYGKSKGCINPCKGSTSGQTWEQRRAFIDNWNENGTYKDDDS
jgi:hypothetical protein